ncbi:high-affinity Zn(2+) transporter zrt1 [Exophiala xenobiotica]|nr:high-affinity Zn(2+) transporter zrt1 [Exophiala xenobiotica]
MLFSTFVLPLWVSAGLAQKTYTGCHNHSSVEYCYGTDGEETPLAKYASSSTLTTFSTATLPASVTASDTTTTLPASVTASATTSSGQTTAVTGCHTHETATYCIDGAGNEVLISATATATGEPPAQYTDCHAHGVEKYCMSPDGEEVLVLAEEAAVSYDSHDDHDDHDDSGEETEMDCHFHAGVEHCVPVGGSESTTSSALCDLQERGYNIGLRVGTLFVVLITSAIGVFVPMLLVKLPSRSINSFIFTTVKQFGTGVIVSTASFT